MKACPVCSLEMEDAYMFCPDDGTSLAACAAERPRGPTTTLASANPQSNDVTAGAAVLYCPACAAEYPLTFSACPVHGVQLTKNRLPAQRNGANTTETLLAQSSNLTTLALERPEIDSPRNAMPKPAVEDANPRPGNVAAITANSTGTSDFEWNSPTIEPAHKSKIDSPRAGFLTNARDRNAERSGFRIAAIATGIALALFGLIALRVLVSHVSRRTSTPVVRAASQDEAAQVIPTIATPQAAQDYKEEQPDAPPQPARPADRKPGDIKSSSNAQRDHRDPIGPSVQKPTPPKPAAAAITRVSNPPLPDLPRGNAGGFDSRLIRVRANKTASGYRYDLAFNLQELAGRSTQWQRMLITTRSASGITHTFAIPFAHRLGATGALTFTVSVEMIGRSLADWQGRINCTTLGWDKTGAPLETSFGTNVSPW